MRQARPDTDGLAQADGAAAADRDDAVGVRFLCVRQRFVRDVRRRVHRCFGEETGDMAAKDALEGFGLRDLLRRG